MTMGQQELSSGHERSVASHETSQPQRIKLKRLDKTAKHIMNILDNKAVDKVRTEREIPDIRPGYIVQLKVILSEHQRDESRRQEGKALLPLGQDESIQEMSIFSPPVVILQFHSPLVTDYIEFQIQCHRTISLMVLFIVLL
ncbi:50S ribosomal protein L19 [Musa troglodytarum]|uniref:50S ribosomal protein L19 n=1 Tax=Musa troglodytarum TaxID=320322 RepID=A0A9E7K029_9LILI|nr:50S ribosomal protein L19 [Musa troglodytarum]